MKHHSYVVFFVFPSIKKINSYQKVLLLCILRLWLYHFLDRFCRELVHAFIYFNQTIFESVFSLFFTFANISIINSCSTSFPQNLELILCLFISISFPIIKLRIKKVILKTNAPFNLLMLINYANIYVNVIFYAKITILTCALVLDPGWPTKPMTRSFYQVNGRVGFYNYALESF